MDAQIHTIRAGAIVCACTEHTSVSHVTREDARSVETRSHTYARSLSHAHTLACTQTHEHPMTAQYDKIRRRSPSCASSSSLGSSESLKALKVL